MSALIDKARRGASSEEGGTVNKRRKTILVAEDDPCTRHIICEIIHDAGHSVDSAKDGLEALAHLERQRYDVLVTDYHMPRLNGLYLLTISRAVWPSLPVVMVSGELGQIRADAIRQGAYAWLSKPYRADQLLKTIERAVTNAPALHGAFEGGPNPYTTGDIQAISERRSAHDRAT